MQVFKSSKAIAMVTTALFIGSLFWLMNTKRVNSSLETGLENERLKTEEYLSEKLLLEKDLLKTKEQLLKLQTTNAELSDVVTSTSAKLANQEADYNRMKKENVSLHQIRKQRKELIALQSQLENELQSNRLSYAELETRNSELSQTVASLGDRNRILMDDLNKAMFAAIDHSQIQAVKGKKEKLTIRARKTNKLIANFEVPANLKNLSFRMVDSKGNSLNQKDGTISSTISPSDESYTATTDSGSVGSKLQKVEMVFIPKARLATGVYTVEILNENLYLGSLKVKLK
jgi:DNA repair exonuclease SbcCD ATPase subunit